MTRKLEDTIIIDPISNPLYECGDPFYKWLVINDDDLNCILIEDQPLINIPTVCKTSSLNKTTRSKETYRAINELYIKAAHILYNMSLNSCTVSSFDDILQISKAWFEKHDLLFASRLIYSSQLINEDLVKTLEHYNADYESISFNNWKKDYVLALPEPEQLGVMPINNDDYSSFGAGIILNNMLLFKLKE